MILTILKIILWVAFACSVVDSVLFSIASVSMIGVSVDDPTRQFIVMRNGLATVELIASAGFLALLYRREAKDEH